MRGTDCWWRTSGNNRLASLSNVLPVTAFSARTKVKICLVVARHAANWSCVATKRWSLYKSEAEMAFSMMGLSFVAAMTWTFSVGGACNVYDIYRIILNKNKINALTFLHDPHFAQDISCTFSSVCLLPDIQQKADRSETIIIDFDIKLCVSEYFWRFFTWSLFWFVSWWFIMVKYLFNINLIKENWIIVN